MSDITSHPLVKELSAASFDQGPKVIAGADHKFDTVFTEAHYTQCLNTLAHLIVDIVQPNVLIRVMKEHQELPVDDYSTEAAKPQKTYRALDMDGLSAAIENGATVNLNMLERLSPDYRAFSEGLEVALNDRVQTNLYYNHGSIAGFSPHYDTHDLFVLQISGEKRWQISHEVTSDVSAATPSHPKNAPASWDEDVVLTRGDMIVLPRGTWHSVAGTGRPSLHLTVGVRTPTFEDYLRWLGSHAGASSALRSRALGPARAEGAESTAVLKQGLVELAQSGVTFERFLSEYAHPHHN